MFKNHLIICVDDASPDCSSEIVQKHLDEDKRVSLIKHETNKGLGGARNTGIKSAKGEYIVCVDSDDTIKKNMLEYLYYSSDDSFYDVVCCGFDEVNSQGDKLHTNSFNNASYKDTQNIDVFSIVNTSFCNKLWRRSLLVENKIYFPENLYFEDVATTPRVLLNASSIKIIDKSLYNYYKREGTITSTFSDKHISDLFEAYKILSSYLESRFIDSSLRFHAQSIDGSNMTKSQIQQYLSKLLESKFTFLGLEIPVGIISKNKTLHLIGSLRAETFENTSIQNNNNYTELNLFQRLACNVIAFVYKPFISSSHYKKLKSYPEFFFKDSKSQFTLLVGKILQIK